MNAFVQYRPYLFLSEIKLIISRLSDDEPEELACKRKLMLVAMKAEAGLADGSYTATPRKSLEEKLELESDDDYMAQIAASTKEKKT